MALRQTTQTHTPESLRDAQLLVLPVRADVGKHLPAQTEEAVMDQSLSDRSHSATRRLRNLIIVGNAVMWLAIFAALRFLFF